MKGKGRGNHRFRLQCDREKAGEKAGKKYQEKRENLPNEIIIYMALINDDSHNLLL